jgi:hypothetical protein
MCKVKTFLIAALSVVAVFALVFMTPKLADFKTAALVDSGRVRSQNTVTLQAAPGNNIVQMFEKVGAGDEGKVSHFPDGTTCKALGGPTAVNIEGISMTFRRVTCNGITGYVNAKWVD